MIDLLVKPSVTLLLEFFLLRRLVTLYGSALSKALGDILPFFRLLLPESLTAPGLSSFPFLSLSIMYFCMSLTPFIGIKCCPWMLILSMLLYVPPPLPLESLAALSIIFRWCT